MGFSSSRLFGLVVAACCIGGAAQAAPPQAPEAAVRSRLVRCAVDTCLLVTGRRRDAAATVAIADHVVAVRGRRVWRVAVPVADIRQWSAPVARSIAVSIIEPGASPIVAQAKLPIGLLGHIIELASLDVRAR